MANALEEAFESDGDDKPATKKDEKKSRHLEIVGVVVGLLALIIGYIVYKRNQSASSSTATTTPPVSGDVAGSGAPGYPYGPSSGGGGAGNGSGPPWAQALLAATNQLDTDITTGFAGLQSQIASGAASGSSGSNGGASGNNNNNTTVGRSGTSGSSSSSSSSSSPSGSFSLLGAINKLAGVKVNTNAVINHGGATFVGVENKGSATTLRGKGYDVVGGAAIGGTKGANYVKVSA